MDALQSRAPYVCDDSAVYAQYPNSDTDSESFAAFARCVTSP